MSDAPFVVTASQLRRERRRCHLANLRCVFWGTLLGVALTWYLAVPTEDEIRVKRVFMTIAEDICRYQNGIDAIVPTWLFSSRRFRFECRTGTVIEQDVVVR